jgi:hypothetical protein
LNLSTDRHALDFIADPRDVNDLVRDAPRDDTIPRRHVLPGRQLDAPLADRDDTAGRPRLLVALTGP